MPLITLTTDFGARDWFVGTMKGVILARAPRTTLVDLTHEIPPGDIRAAAFALRCGWRYFPRGTVHVVVVDPGVGSARAALAARADGQFLVGPDNGALSWALIEARVHTVRRVEFSRVFLRPVSATFHGRDVFAPVAAYLARGGAFTRLGPVTEEFVRLPWPETRVTPRGTLGEVVYVDRFGNAITNIPGVRRMLAGGPPSGHRLRVRLPRGGTCPLGTCYASVRPGQAVCVPGSSGFLEIAVHGGSAARQLGLRVGDAVRVELGDA